MRRALARFLRPGALVALIALTVVAGVRLNDGSDASAAEKFTAYVGGGAGGVAVETFRPATIFVHPGDTVEWVNPYEEIHTVTFVAPGGEVPALIVPLGPPPAAGPPTLIFNPEAAFPTTEAEYDGTAFANSGILNKGDTFALTFPELGSFSYLCILHPGMVGAIQVLRSDVHIPTQAELERDAAAQLARDLAAGEASAASAKASKTANDDGSTTWEVVNAPSAGQADVMRFIPQKVSINLNDTVTWTNETFVPHTVTFSSGAAPPELVLPEPQTAGPPNLVINPAVLFPSGAADGTYDGTGYVNSGFDGAGPESQIGTTFSLKFTKPGTYLYICVLHADQGMAGVIEVSATSGITPPSTGDAGLASGRASTWAGLVVIAAAALLSGAALLRRRASV